MKNTFKQYEEKNGLRWTWNILPSTSKDAQKIIVPISSLCTPLKESKNVLEVKYNPVTCKNCRAVLNPYCRQRVDFQNGMWACTFCLQHNKFPQSYSGISKEKMPAELYPQYTTIEYVLRRQKGSAPFFLYVIDTCIPKDQLATLKESILMSFDLIPENSYVGLITFGTTVQLYELGYTECSKAYVFRGDKAPTINEFQEQIGLSAKYSNQNKKTQYVKSKFIVPLDEFEMNITNIIEDIKSDPWPVKQNCRDRRCTGVALSVATSLCETGFKNIGGHIMNFISGPCTMGDGKIVGLPKKEHIRIHNDIQNDSAPYFKKAVKFYQNLKNRLVTNGHTLDIFCANLDQVGLYEMKSMCDNSGGILIMTSSFENPIYKESLTRLLEQDDDGNLKFGFNGSLEVLTSPTVKICGGLGPMASMNQKTSCVSENEVGYGNTNAWKINCITKTTTVAIFYELGKQVSSLSNNRYFQFLTAYTKSNGEHRLRVTTTALRSTQQSLNFNEIASSFDQEAAAVVMTRLAIFKAESEYLFDVLRGLDRSLIKLIRRFGEYQKDQPNSLRLSSSFNYYPQFMYHLRRGHFLRVFNCSPDETCYYRFYMNRETTKNSLTMIQPVVMFYSFSKKAHPVNLDSMMLTPEAILLLDCFDTILIYYGSRISAWKSSGYDKQEKYQSFKKLLHLPVQDAKKIIENRFPYPRYIECEEGSSQARIIYAKVNPSTTHKTPNYGNDQESIKILTDDSSLQFFMKHLKELVVANEKE